MIKSEVFAPVPDRDFLEGGSGGVCLFHADSSDAPALSRGSSTTSCEKAGPCTGALGRERGGQPSSFPLPTGTTHATCSFSQSGEHSPTRGWWESLGLPLDGWAVFLPWLHSQKYLCHHKNLTWPFPPKSSLSALSRPMSAQMRLYSHGCNRGALQPHVPWKYKHTT